MKTWQGKIAKHFSRDFQGTKLYSFQIEEVDRWFRTGKEKIPQEVGKFIEFTERNSNVDLSTVKEIDSTQTVSTTAEQDCAVQNESGKTSPPKSTTHETVGQRMAWEAARRDATRIVATALEVEGKGLDVLPWAKNTAKAKRLDLLVSYVNKVADQLMEKQNES